MLKLRPHHIIDIIRDYGQEKDFVPHVYGHDFHKVASLIIENINQVVELVISSDDICSPCIHLQADNRCDDRIPNHPVSELKQVYNDYLDNQIIKMLSLYDNINIPVSDYLLILAKRIDIFDKIYPQSKDIVEKRKTSFLQGLLKLGLIQ